MILKNKVFLSSSFLFSCFSSTASSLRILLGFSFVFRFQVLSLYNIIHPSGLESLWPLLQNFTWLYAIYFQNWSLSLGFSQYILHKLPGRFLQLRPYNATFLLKPNDLPVLIGCSVCSKIPRSWLLLYLSPNY